MTRRIAISTNQILACRERLSVHLTSEQLHNLGLLLERRQGEVPHHDELAALGISPTLRATVRRELGTLERPRDLAMLALLLLTVPGSPRDLPVEICWTGPQPKGRLTTRATEPALEELIQSARESIVVVGYQIQSGAAPILSILKGKVERGVRVTFFLDKRAVGTYFRRWVRDVAESVQVYVRPMSRADPMSALHAKCVIVDGSVGMFGSANLTFHGLRGNVELGLLVRNRDVMQRVLTLLSDLKTHLKPLVP